MKLYAFQPTGHGQLSFFVMAVNESEAYLHVCEHIDELYRNDDDSLKYCAQGWGTSDYVLTEVGEGTIIENDND